MRFRSSSNGKGSGFGFRVGGWGGGGFARFRVRGSRCGSMVMCWLVGFGVVRQGVFSCERSSGELVKRSMISVIAVGASVV